MKLTSARAGLGFAHYADATPSRMKALANCSGAHLGIDYTGPRSLGRATTNTKDWSNIFIHVPAIYYRTPHGCV